MRQILPELQARHEERATKDPDFIYLKDMVDRMIEVRQRTTIPLNRDALKAQRDADRRAAFDANNMRLMAKGLPLEEWEDEESEEEVEGADLAMMEDDATSEDEDADPLLEESGRILVDLAELLGRPMTASTGSQVSTANLSRL